MNSIILELSALENKIIDNTKIYGLEIHKKISEMLVEDKNDLRVSNIFGEFFKKRIELEKNEKYKIRITTKTQEKLLKLRDQLFQLAINEENIKESKILFSYFFKNSGKRILVINPLTRLWWVGRQVYDSSNTENPFYALEFLKRDFGTKVLNLFSYNYANNPKITRAILVALSEIEKENNIVLVRNIYLKIFKYLNMLGGIIILDSLEQEEIIEKIKN